MSVFYKTSEPQEKVHRNTESYSLIEGIGTILVLMVENSIILGSESVKKRDEDSDDGSPMKIRNGIL